MKRQETGMSLYALVTQKLKAAGPVFEEGYEK